MERRLGEHAATPQCPPRERRAGGRDEGARDERAVARCIALHSRLGGIVGELQPCLVEELEREPHLVEARAVGEHMSAQRVLGPRHGRGQQ
jgi:hypothetical protein